MVNLDKYRPLAWLGLKRATSAEMTTFGLIGLFNFIACGSLLLTHLWCRNTLDLPRRIRLAYRSRWKRSGRASQGEMTADVDDWFELEFQADRTTLNLLAVSCLSTPPWILLYLDREVAYGVKPPNYGVCLVQGSFVMTWAVFMAAGAFGVIMKIWPRITRINSSLMPYVMPLWLEGILFALPWFLLVCFFSAALALGLQKPQRVLMGQFYCWIFSPKLQRATLGVSCALLIIVLVLEIHIFIFIFRHLTISGNTLTATAPRPPPLEEGTEDLPATHGTLESGAGSSEKSRTRSLRFKGIRIGIIARPMAFGFCCLLGLGMATVTLVVDRTASWGKLVLATIPSFTFFAYASQPEILRVWGLGRLLGETTTKETTPGRWDSSTRGPADQDVPRHHSISQAVEFKSKSSSTGHGLEDIAVANLGYDSPQTAENPRPVETPKSPRSGAELFQKGLKEWHVIMEDADRGVSGQSTGPAKPRKRSL